MSIDIKRINSNLKKAKNGDGTAFVEFYNYTYRFILNYVLGIVKDIRDAEDIVCDTMDKLYTHLSDFDENKSGFGWAVTIAKNTALDYLKKFKAETVNVDGLVDERFYNGNEDGLLTKFDIEKALESFNDYEKILFGYIADEGVTYQEISEQVGKPVATVYRGVQKVRKKMKNILTE